MDVEGPWHDPSYQDSKGPWLFLVERPGIGPRSRPVDFCFLLLETVKGQSPAMQTPGLWFSAQLVSSAGAQPCQCREPLV